MLKNYEEAVAYIHARPRIKKEKTQKRILNLLEKLGNPQQQVTAVHVVGTNGKGSVVAYLTSLLVGIKQKVGTFTSPFMIRFNERISIDQQPISDAALLQLVNRVKPIIDEIDSSTEDLGPSEFETITALMYLYFAEQKVDIALVEAGIGGESDSTNVDDNAIMTIITTIGLDHMKLLGDTISEIARTKAGIIKPQTPTIVGKVSSDALNVIKTVADRRKSDLIIADKDYEIKLLDPNHFSYQDQALQISKIKTNLLGKFEMEDAGVAIAAFHQLNHWRRLTKTQVRENIQVQIPKTKWIGRMEIVKSHPLTMIDGAHNVPAVRKLRESLANYDHYQIDLVMAVFADKQYQQMVHLFAEMPNVTLHLTSFNPNEQRAVANFDLVEQAQKFEYQPNWQSLIKELRQKNKVDQQRMILITGSLLFISEVRKYLLGN